MKINYARPQQSFFKQVFITTLQAARFQVKADNDYENIGSSIDFIVDELLTYKILFPRQIGKTFILREIRDKLVATATEIVVNKDIFFIDLVGGLGATGNDVNYFILNNKNEYDKLKQIIEETPDKGYVFILDNGHNYEKINDLKYTIKNLFKSISKDSKQNFYFSFIIIE